jgi:hypothetical protein
VGVLVWRDVLPLQCFVDVVLGLLQRPERDVEVLHEHPVRSLEALRDVGGRRTCRFADLFAELEVSTNLRTIGYCDHLPSNLCGELPAD